VPDIGSYFVYRIIQGVIILLVVSTVVFFVMHVVGDPVRLILPMEASPEEVERVRSLMGLNDPLPTQYGRFLWGAARLDFGLSLWERVPAADLVLQRLPATLLLALSSMALALIIAVPAGVIAAVKRGTLFDSMAMVGTFFAQSMPVFWSGILLILLFGVKLHLLPTFGYGTPRHLILPVLTLAGYEAARIARITRSSVLEVLGQDFIRTARAKGLHSGRVYFKHALKNAAIPIVAVIGVEYSVLFGGAVITETVFAYPGLGSLALRAITYRDFPLVQAAVFVIALNFVVVTWISELLYVWFNPRYR